MNSQTPKVSVVIPMYNTEKYIAQCLESIITQTLQDYEVIIIDDCSTDNSVAIVESMIPKIMSINKELNRRNLNFTKSESRLMINIRTQDMSPADKQKIDMIMGMM